MHLFMCWFLEISLLKSVNILNLSCILISINIFCLICISKYIIFVFRGSLTKHDILGISKKNCWYLYLPLKNFFLQAVQIFVSHIITYFIKHHTIFQVKNLFFFMCFMCSCIVIFLIQ